MLRDTHVRSSNSLDLAEVSFDVDSEHAEKCGGDAFGGGELLVNQSLQYVTLWTLFSSAYVI